MGEKQQNDWSEKEDRDDKEFLHLEGKLWKKMYDVQEDSEEEVEMGTLGIEGNDWEEGCERTEEGGEEIGEGGGGSLESWDGCVNANGMDDALNFGEDLGAVFESDADAMIETLPSTD